MVTIEFKGLETSYCKIKEDIEESNRISLLIEKYFKKRLNDLDGNIIFNLANTFNIFHIINDAELDKKIKNRIDNNILPSLKSCKDGRKIISWIIPRK